jgi:exopolysaccharide biosynthesis predicted pyruvyltransferase EpsI
LDLYIKPLVEEGHFVEIVTNMTITPMVKKILSWGNSLLKRVEFKCSFHYLELEKHNLLDVFVRNVHNAREAGASICIEMTPSDELIPYIQQVKKISIENFGALPQLTIARDDSTPSINYLTRLPLTEYDTIWSQFNSDFWEFKRSVFGVKQKKFCYAGQWSASISIDTGEAHKCYHEYLGNVFMDPDAPFPESPIGKCPIAHCYNAHAFLTLGCIPNVTTKKYGDIRNRVCQDGSHWLQPEMKDFLNSNLSESNNEISFFAQKKILFKKNRILVRLRHCFRNEGVMATLKKIVRRIFKSNALSRRIYDFLSVKKAKFSLWREIVLPVLLTKYFHPKVIFFVLTPTHGNMGDHAIAKASGLIFDKYKLRYHEVTYEQLKRLEQLDRVNVFNGRSVIINGGGNIGTLWFDVEMMMRNIIEKNPDSKIVVLPNSVYYEDTNWGKTEFENSQKIYSKHNNLTIFLREKLSYNAIKDSFGNIHLVPDLVLSLNECRPGFDRQGCMICLRCDHERTITNEIGDDILCFANNFFPGSVKISDTVLPKSVSISERNSELEHKLDEFRQVKLVITDRLHGMIFSAITGTPCIVINSNSPKLLGSLEWLKHLNFIKFCENTAKIYDIYKSIPDGNFEYDPAILSKYYETIGELLIQKNQ